MPSNCIKICSCFNALNSKPKLEIDLKLNLLSCLALIKLWILAKSYIFRHLQYLIFLWFKPCNFVLKTRKSKRTQLLLEAKSFVLTALSCLAIQTKDPLGLCQPSLLLQKLTYAVMALKLQHVQTRLLRLHEKYDCPRLSRQ